MSLFPGTLFGRRKTELPPNYHRTWAHPTHQDNSFGVTPRTTTPPYHHHVAGFHGEQPQMPSPMVNSHVEWKETPEAHVYKAHLPGLKRSDVRVEVDDDRVLCIICERSVEKEEQRDGWHRVEVSSGQFVQRLTLPENSKVDHVKAYMDNGVLTIHVPKHRATVNNRARNIQISHV